MISIKNLVLSCEHANVIETWSLKKRLEIGWTLTKKIMHIRFINMFFLLSQHWYINVYYSAIVYVLFLKIYCIFILGSYETCFSKYKFLKVTAFDFFFLFECWGGKKIEDCRYSVATKCDPVVRLYIFFSHVHIRKR